LVGNSHLPVLDLSAGRFGIGICALGHWDLEFSYLEF
jgi:hypothetical protein